MKKNELQLFAVIGDRSEKPFRIILHLLTLKNTLLTIEKGLKKAVIGVRTAGCRVPSVLRSPA